MIFIIDVVFCAIDYVIKKSKGMHHNTTMQAYDLRNASLTSLEPKCK